MSFEPSTYIDDDSFDLLENHFTNNNIQKNDVLDENIIKLMANDQFENYIKYYKISDLEDNSDKCSKLQNFFVKVPKTNNKKIDIDLSFYAKSEVKQEIFKLDFEAEYYRNLAELKKCRYEIDKDTILTHEFEFYFKYIPIYNSRISGLNWIKKKYNQIDDVKGTELKSDQLKDKPVILNIFKSKNKLTIQEWSDNGPQEGGYISKDHYILGENNTYFIPEEEYVYENININNENISYYKANFKLDIDNLDKLKNGLNENNIIDLIILYFDNDNKFVEDPNLTLYKYSDEDNVETKQKIESHIQNFLVMNLKHIDEIEEKSQYNIIALQYRSFYLKILINIFILYSIFNYFEKSYNSQIIFDNRVVKSNTIKEEINNIIKYQLKIIIENFYKLVDDENEYSIKAILDKHKEIKYQKIQKREKEIEKLEKEIEKKNKQLNNYKKKANDLAHPSHWVKKDNNYNQDSELNGNEKIKGYFEILIKSSENSKKIISIDEGRYNMYKDDNNPIYMYNYIKIDDDKYYPIESNNEYKIGKEKHELTKIKDDLEKSSYIKEESKQILDAKKYKSELTDINNFIEKEKKKNEKSKKVLEYNKSYLNKVDIALYFIIFIFIVIIFLFVFDYAVTNISITVPIILFSIIILTFLFLSFIQKKNNPKKKNYNFLDILFKNKIIEDFFNLEVNFVANRQNECKDDERTYKLTRLSRYHMLIKHYCGLFSQGDIAQADITEYMVENINNLIISYLKTDENNRLHIKFVNNDIYSVYPLIGDDKNFTNSSSSFNENQDISRSIDSHNSEFYDAASEIEKYNNIFEPTGLNRIYDETSDNIDIVYEDTNYYYLIFIHNNASNNNLTEYTLHLPVDIDDAVIIAIGGGGHGYNYSQLEKNSAGGGGAGAPICKKTKNLLKGNYVIKVSRGNIPPPDPDPDKVNELESSVEYINSETQESDYIIKAPNAKNDKDGRKQDWEVNDYSIESDTIVVNGGSGGTAGKMRPRPDSLEVGDVYFKSGQNMYSQESGLDNPEIHNVDNASGENGIEITEISALGSFSAGGGATRYWELDNRDDDIETYNGNTYLKLKTGGFSEGQAENRYRYYIRNKLENGLGGGPDEIGGNASDEAGNPGQPHTGSGGGGSRSESDSGGNGGSGIVIIKFSKSDVYFAINTELHLLSLNVLKESLHSSATILNRIGEHRNGVVNELETEIKALELEINTLYSKDLTQNTLNRLLDDLERKKNELIGETGSGDANYQYHYWKKTNESELNGYKKIELSQGFSPENQELLRAALKKFEEIYYDSSEKNTIIITENSKDIIITGINIFNQSLEEEDDKQKIYFEISHSGNTRYYRPMMTGMKNIVDGLMTKITTLESAIENKKNDIGELQNIVSRLNQDYRNALREKSSNKMRSSQTLQGIKDKEAEKTQKLLRFEELKADYHIKVKQFIEYESCRKALETALYNDDDGLQAKLTNNKEENARIRREHTAYVEAEKAKKRNELRKLSNLRDLAISKIAEYETKYKDELANYIETSEQYGVSYINLKLAIDYKLAGFDFDLEDTDQSEDISKIVLNEREKRRKFVNRILSDLIKGTEELNNIQNNKKITRSRFEILRIYPDDTPNQNTETTYEPETFTNFQVEEYFSEVGDCTTYDNENDCLDSDCEWYPEYQLCGNKGTATGTTTLDQYESANRYQPQNKITVVSIKINPHQETLLVSQQIKPTSKEIVDKIAANAGILTSKLRSETRYLRYIVATQIYNDTDELDNWERKPSASIITIDDENAESNKDTLEDIITNINYIIDVKEEEIQDTDSYYDNVHKYVEKEYNDYKDTEGKVLLNSRMYDDKKNIDYLDIRIKELLHQYILSVSLILCLSMILNKFIFRSIMIILLIIIIVLVSVYYISGIIIIMRTKAKNSYWKKPKKELLE
jgi:hypothetical protein